MAELAPVRGVFTAPITLSGTGQVSYGATVGSTGATERWLVTAQADGTQNGIYDVTTGGAWTRSTDLDTSAEFNNLPWVQVKEGNSRIARSVWVYTGPDNPTLGTTNLTFTMRSHGDVWVPGTGLDAFNNELRLIERPGVSGDWANPSLLSLTDRGIVDDIDAAEAAEADTFIEGLKLVYLSANSLRVEAGQASLPDGTSASLSANSDKTLTLTSGQWYYIYIFSSGGAGDWEYSTQAPTSTPYLGNARAKGPDGTPDLTRRYVRAIYASGANTMRRFVILPGGW